MVAAEAEIPGPLGGGLGEARVEPVMEPVPAHGGVDPSSPVQAEFQNQIEALLAQRARAAPQAPTRAAVRTRRVPWPLWFKIPVLLVAAGAGMAVISWHDGVTGGFYGRLIGHVGILGIALILVVPVLLLLVVGRWLPRPEDEADAESEEAVGLAA
ncbi:hypothetical protein [Methylobacterium mesophilicum]|uniref:hypothetical protein n=1 Tax=Methylobacterium mesophilicum TaxID=39956 RepID=UPI0002C61408|nr:hypothetical protein [Methylobacterium mesophilicum]